MNALIASLGGKLAERWLTDLVLPGVVFVTVGAMAARLGHSGWSDLGLLGQEADRFAAGLRSGDNGSVLLVALAVLLASTVAAAVAQGLQRLVSMLWTSDWGAVGEVLARRRRRRWADAVSRYEAALKEKARQLRAPAPHGESLPDVQALARACDRIALTEPARPTWIGDRMLAAARRVESRYDLDLAGAWPRIWLLLSEDTRGPLTLAQNDFADAARRVAWGILYIALGVLWWPAALIGLGLCLAGWRDSRRAVTVLADLVEAVVDLHVGALGAALGHTTNGTFTKADGHAVTLLLNRAGG